MTAPLSASTPSALAGTTDGGRVGMNARLFTYQDYAIIGRR